MKHIKYYMLIYCALLAVMSTTGCKRDNYYTDGGKANGRFNGSIMGYLASKPVPFDSLVQIIKLAGLDKTLSTEEITFFAPTDVSIKALIGRSDLNGINARLYFEGKDTVKVLADIDSAIWRKYLLRYIYKGKNKLQDYPQIDFNQRSIYPGQIYYSYSKAVANIGVFYNDAGGIKYMGYRQLHISYIPDISRPLDNWRITRVSSSDIEPDNGIVHVLEVRNCELGFNQGEMENEISDSKR